MKNMHLIKSLLAFGLTALTLSSVARQTGTTPQTPPDSRETIGAQVGKPQIVTHSYFRMHHPLFLASLAKQVAGGSASKEKLIRLAGPNFANVLLASNLSTLPTHTKGGATGGGKQPDKKIIMHNLGIPVTVGPSDYYPQSIDYSDLVPGEEETRSVNVMSPIDGTVKATVSKLPKDFQILLMESYSGLAANSSDGASEIPDLTSTTGSMPVTGGQNFSVVMQVGSAIPGTYTADLTLTCTGNSVNASQYWTIKIPMKIVVSAANYYRAEYQGTPPKLLVFPGTSFNIKAKINPINYHGPFKATIVTKGFSSDFSAETTTVSFNSNAPVTATIKCHCAGNTPFQENALLGSVITADNGQDTTFFTILDVAPFQVKVDYGNYSSSISYSGIPPFGSVGSFTMAWNNATVVFDADGDFTLVGTVDTTYSGNWPVSEMDPIQAGVYIIDEQNQAHGSYDQISGQTDYIKSVWLPFSQGRLKSAVWFAPAHCAKYYNDGLPPIDANGNFFAFIGYNLLVHRW